MSGEVFGVEKLGFSIGPGSPRVSKAEGGADSHLELPPPPSFLDRSPPRHLHLRSALVCRLLLCADVVRLLL